MTRTVIISLDHGITSYPWEECRGDKEGYIWRAFVGLSRSRSLARMLPLTLISFEEMLYLRASRPEMTQADVMRGTPMFISQNGEVGEMVIDIFPAPHASDMFLVMDMTADIYIGDLVSA